MSTHAKLSPSSANRWFTCPGSIAAIAADTSPPPPYSPAAARGTFIHDLAANTLNGVGPLYAEAPDSYTQEDIEGYQQIALDYQDYINDLGATAEGAELLVEVSVETGYEDCYGTADAVLISPDGDRVDVIDLKTGSVPVEPADNPQLFIYAIGVLRLIDMMGYAMEDIQTIGIHIYQPVQGGGVFVETTLEELGLWKSQVLEKAINTIKDDPDKRVPSTTACRYCPVKLSCPEYNADALENARSAFAAVPPSTPEDTGVIAAAIDAAIDGGAPEAQAATPPGKILETALTAVPGLRRWANDIEARALQHMMGGGTIEGFKLVRKVTRRKWADNVEARVARLLGAKVAYVKELVSPTQAVKLVKAQQSKEKADDMVGKLAKLWWTPDGAATTAPEKDKRPKMNPEDFD